MTKYLVIGFYEESGQTFTFDIEASDPHQAMAQCATDSLQGDSDAGIVGVSYLNASGVMEFHASV